MHVRAKSNVPFKILAMPKSPSFTLPLLVRKTFYLFFHLKRKILIYLRLNVSMENHVVMNVLNRQGYLHKYIKNLEKFIVTSVSNTSYSGNRTPF